MVEKHHFFWGEINYKYYKWTIFNSKLFARLPHSPRGLALGKILVIRTVIRFESSQVSENGGFTDSPPSSGHGWFVWNIMVNYGESMVNYGESMVNIWWIYGESMVNNGESMDNIWYIWVNLITTSLFSRALEIMVYLGGIIPFYGRTIQVSEIL